MPKRRKQDGVSKSHETGNMPKRTEQNEVSKREGVICKDDYYMAIAVLSKERSKDPDFQVGACIVNENDRVVGIGYNGMPNRCSDDEMPWAKEKGTLKNKHLYVCHAELNAIVNNNASDLTGCRSYCTLAPCCECAKLITQSGIAKVIYFSDEKGDRVDFKASRKIFAKAGIAVQKFEPKTEIIELNLKDESEVKEVKRPRRN